MQTFFSKRKFLLLGFSFFMALGVVFFSAIKVYAVSSISSITGGIVTYTGTTFTPVVTFADTSSGDLGSIYITSSSSSGTLGSYSGHITSSGVLGVWAPTLTFGSAYLTYTGANLRLHGFITDSGYANTGYLSQAISFSKDVYREIYGGIYLSLSGAGINNNFNTVTGGNVTSFVGLYFALMSGTSELGRITFPGALDLTDSDVITLLQNLGSGNVMDMDEGYIKFSPGVAAALNSGATIKMNFGAGCEYISGINSANDFIVRDSSGESLDATTIISSVTSVYGGNSGYISFSASHFTDFTLRPDVTSLKISSNNSYSGAYAKVGNIVTVSVTFDTISDDVDMTLTAGTWSSAMAVTGAGKTWTGTYTVTTGDQGLFTFNVVANFPSRPSIVPTYSQSNITNGSSVTFDSIASATITYTPATATSGNVLAVLSGYETLTGANATGYTFTGNGTSGFTYSDLIGNTGASTATVTWIDKTAPTISSAGAVTYLTTQTPHRSFISDEAGTIAYSGLCSSTTTAAISGTNAIVFSALSNATYSTCQVKVTDAAGNISSRLTVPTFTVDYTAPSGGGGGGVNQKDDCPNGDKSLSLYDGTCEAGGQPSGTQGSIVGSPFSTELNNAYLYAFNIGITTMDTIQRANIEGNLIRAHMAKMMVNYAVKVLGLTPDTSLACTFNDIADQSAEMKGYIKLACQLGLMGQDIENFNPTGTVSRAQFGTILSRALYGTQYEGMTPYYAGHLAALKDAGIITNTNPDLKELRGYVMLMLMRARDN